MAQGLPCPYCGDLRVVTERTGRGKMGIGLGVAGGYLAFQVLYLSLITAFRFFVATLVGEAICGVMLIAGISLYQNAPTARRCVGCKAIVPEQDLAKTFQ